MSSTHKDMNHLQANREAKLRIALVYYKEREREMDIIKYRHKHVFYTCNLQSSNK